MEPFKKIGEIKNEIKKMAKEERMAQIKKLNLLYCEIELEQKKSTKKNVQFNIQFKNENLTIPSKPIDILDWDCSHWGKNTFER